MENERNFPYEVFPKKFINDFNDYYDGFSEEKKAAVIASILTCIGVPIANRFELIITDTWKERSNLFMCIVANSGQGKTPLMGLPVKPLRDYQFNNILNEKNRLEGLRIEYESLKKRHDSFLRRKDGIKEKNYITARNALITFIGDNDLPNELIVQNGKTDEISGTPIQPAIFKEFPTSIFPTIYNSGGTSQAREKIMYNNRGRSFLIYNDELTDFWGDMNRYSKGGDESKFLNYFDYSPIRIDLMDDDKTREIKDKTVSCLFAVQTSQLSNIFNKRSMEKGLVQRFLFTQITENEKTNPFTNLKEKKDKRFETYTELAQHFLNGWLGDYKKDKYVDRLVIHYDDAAIDYLPVWRDNLNQHYTENHYDISNEIYNSFVAKFDHYIHRFAIIMSRMRIYFEALEGKYDYIEMINSNITIEDLKAAEKVVNFYLQTTFEFQFKIESNFNNKLSNDDIKILEKMDNNTSFYELSNLIIKITGKTSRTAANIIKRLINDKFLGKTKDGKYYSNI